MNNHWLRALQQRLQGIPRTPREINYSLQLLSVMRSLGWHKSLHQVQPIDKSGSPIPWYTYSQLEWLMPRVKQTDTVFEFGAGYSTAWYGQHAKEVITVEHNSRWLDEVRTMVGRNVTLLFRTTSGTDATVEDESPYCNALREYPPKSFDIIVIDGMERIQCAYAAPSRLRDDGIIVFDNSDRISYRPGIDYLHKQGFGRVDFYGFVPQMGVRNCTSIFSMFGTRWTTENVPLVSQGW
jgi:hypothetical protein